MPTLLLGVVLLLLLLWARHHDDDSGAYGREVAKSPATSIMVWWTCDGAATITTGPL